MSELAREDRDGCASREMKWPRKTPAGFASGRAFRIRLTRPADYRRYGATLLAIASHSRSRTGHATLLPARDSVQP